MSLMIVLPAMARMARFAISVRVVTSLLLWVWWPGLAWRVLGWFGWAEGWGGSGGAWLLWALVASEGGLRSGDWCGIRAHTRTRVINTA